MINCGCWLNSFHLRNEKCYTLTTNNNITGICASTFDVVVKDDHGCLITSTETVNEPSEVTFTSAETPSTCSDPNGEITITASGGTIGYTYSIDNGATYVGGNNFTGLTAGTYDLMVLDNNGCPASGIQTVTDMASPSITMVTKTDPLCKDRKSTRLNSSHVRISYAVFCLKKKNREQDTR